MNDPEERDQKSCDRASRAVLQVLITASKRCKKFPEQKIEKSAARHMEQNVGEMKSVKVPAPQQVIQHEGKILERAVMRRE